MKTYEKNDKTCIGADGVSYNFIDLHQVSSEELLHNMMQAELMHRIIMILSFVPILFILPFGAPIVFITTSILAALIDFVFVAIQRYNRPRVVKYIDCMERRKHDSNS